MPAAAGFHSQIASIVEALANAAVAEICKLVDDGYAVAELEMSRSQRENELLRRKMKLLELQLARYRAEGAAGCRFPGGRLLQRQSRGAAAGPPLQTRTRFLNRGPGAQQAAHKARTTKLDQDQVQDQDRVRVQDQVQDRVRVQDQVQDQVQVRVQDQVQDQDQVQVRVQDQVQVQVQVQVQDVVTTTRTESAELQEAEEEAELLIVKVEGATEPRPADLQAQSTRAAAAAAAAAPVPAAPVPAAPEVSSPGQLGGRRSQTEVSGSDAAMTPATDSSSDSVHSSQPQPTASHVGAAAAATRLCGDVAGGRTGARTAVAASKPPQSEVIVIDGGETQQSATNGGRQAASPMIQCARLEAEPRPVHTAALLPAGGPCGGVQPSFYRAVAMERPYGCSSCPKRFFLQADLHKHAARHGREKPYACTLCGKSFVCQSQLDIHRNVHTGERPFGCGVCSRRFSHPSNLKRHQKIQHSGPGGPGGPGGPPPPPPPPPSPQSHSRTTTSDL